MYAKKTLGQHFLRCAWVASTLVKAAELSPQDTVLEIGPGTGILTGVLAKHVKRVFAVEKDEKLAEELNKRLTEGGIKNVTIISGDILKVLCQTKFGTRYKVVANIPYYLTSRLLRVLFEQKQRPSLVVLTIQKEVAQRITAKPPRMNLLALSVQAYGNPEIIKNVPASCFWPQPKVESAIVRISNISTRFFHQSRRTQNSFFKLARRAFSQKRKILGHSLKGKVLSDSLKPKRPQELGLEEWLAITVQINKARR